jgi:hypothetical protein
MVERIANLFVYIDGDTISELGAAFHEADGTDSEKVTFLKSQVDSDYRTCRRFRLVEAVALRKYEFMARVRRVPSRSRAVVEQPDHGISGGSELPPSR